MHAPELPGVCRDGRGRSSGDGECRVASEAGGDGGGEDTPPQVSGDGRDCASWSLQLGALGI